MTFQRVPTRATDDGVRRVPSSSIDLSSKPETCHARTLTTGRQLLKWIKRYPKLAGRIMAPTTERNHRARLMYDAGEGLFVFFPDLLTLTTIGNKALFERLHTHDNGLNATTLQPILEQIQAVSLDRHDIFDVVEIIESDDAYIMNGAKPRTPIYYYSPFHDQDVPTSLTVSSDGLSARVRMPRDVSVTISRQIRELRTVASIFPLLDADEARRLIKSHPAFEPFRAEIISQVRSALVEAGVTNHPPS